MEFSRSHLWNKQLIKTLYWTPYIELMEKRVTPTTNGRKIFVRPRNWNLPPCWKIGNRRLWAKVRKIAHLNGWHYLVLLNKHGKAIKTCIFPGYLRVRIPSWGITKRNGKGSRFTLRLHTWTDSPARLWLIQTFWGINDALMIFRESHGCYRQRAYNTTRHWRPRRETIYVETKYPWNLGINTSSSHQHWETELKVETESILKWRPSPHLV
jgi:hypothetical protein